MKKQELKSEKVKKCLLSPQSIDGRTDDFISKIWRGFHRKAREKKQHFSQVKGRKQRHIHVSFEISSQKYGSLYNPSVYLVETYPSAFFLGYSNFSQLFAVYITKQHPPIYLSYFNCTIPSIEHFSILSLFYADCKTYLILFKSRLNRFVLLGTLFFLPPLSPSFPPSPSPLFTQRKIHQLSLTSHPNFLILILTTYLR